MNRARSRQRLASCMALLLVNSARALSIEWVTVGDLGNVADDTGYGAVAEAFQIMKFEWTNSQYVEFLNAVDAMGTNPNGIFNTGMSSDVRGGISFDQGAASGRKYLPKPHMGDKPVNYVSWWDAARVANWLHNGRGSGGTETGAYTLNGGTSGDAPAVNLGALFFIPTENQWYKAAYYKGGGRNAGYWDYATQSNAGPTRVTADAVGNGSAGPTGNFANYNTGADWRNTSGGNVTTVGTNGGASAYGTFDMGGNIFEWNELTGAVGSGRGIRGGNWGWYDGTSGTLSSARRHGYGSIEANAEGSGIGFRLASPVIGPEPVSIFVGSGTETQTRQGYPLLSGGVPVVKWGGGTLVLDTANTLASTLSVNGGAVITTNVQAIGSAALNISEGAALILSADLGPLNPLRIEEFGSILGKLDVVKGRFTLVDPSNSGESVEALLRAGRNGGTWDGSRGITSSVVESDAAAGIARSIGWKANPDASVTVAYAAPGDTNLDGDVDVFDLVNINSSGAYGASTASVWSQGDFDYNGVTNIFDLVLVSGAGVYGAGGYLSAAVASTSVNAVPEPSIGFLALAGLSLRGFLKRRRCLDMHGN